jgi:hypothetical protein
MNFHSSCDGFCSPRPWEAHIEEKLFFERKGMTTLLDERRPNEHLLVVEDAKTFEPYMLVVFARWKDGASSYLYCEAVLKNDLRAAWRSFAEACRGMKATWPT